MSQKENIFIADDKPYAINALRCIIEDLGSEEWKVVGTANSVDEARRVIDKLTEQQTIVTLGIIDHRMPDESDGKLVAIQLKQAFPQVKTASFSTYEDEEITWGDFNWDKGSRPTEIVKLIRNT